MLGRLAINRKDFSIWLSLALIAIVMLCSSGQFSMNGDERSQMLVGHNVFRYLGQCLGWIPGEPQAITLNYYGGLFGVVAEAIQQLFPKTDVLDLRHLLVAITGFFTIFFAGKTARLLHSKTAQFCTIWMLFLSPRFFAASMNNSKDIPFALGMIMATYFLLKIVRAAPVLRFKYFLGLGFGLFIAIGVRIGGVMFAIYAAIAFAFVAHKFCTANRKFVWKSLLAFTLTALLAFAAAMVFLPFVWPNLLMASARSIQAFSNYHIGVTMLYMGQDLPTSMPPWHYLPVWIGITTPVVILVLFLGSVIFLFQKNAKAELLILWATVLIPWFIILVLHSPVYDAWRQFFFIYPPMVVLAGMASAAAFKAIRNRKLKMALVGILVLAFFPSTLFSIRNHPLEGVYFNELVGGVDGAFGHYETDFYGESVEMATEKLLQQAAFGKPLLDSVFVLDNVPTQIDYYLRRYDSKISIRHDAYVQRDSLSWDYGIFYSRGLDGLLHRKDWPPRGMIDSVVIGRTMLMAIVKNPNQSKAKTTPPHLRF
jgi:4-amino-4-deoxy-L-arabinose transferase-like glycosyltransferase